MERKIQMNLTQLSDVYRDSAAQISARMRALRAAEHEARDPDEVRQLQIRLAALRPLLQEANELSVLLAHYYDRSYHKNEKYTV